jgi:hypothetical protein
MVSYYKYNKIQVTVSLKSLLEVKYQSIEI